MVSDGTERTFIVLTALSRIPLPGLLLLTRLVLIAPSSALAALNDLMNLDEPVGVA